MAELRHIALSSAASIALLLVASPPAAANAGIPDGGLTPGIQAADYDRQWRFKVMLDDREIGEHSFKLTYGQGSEQVDINARFEVKFAFITAYAYDHSNTERWQAGCLSRIDSSTDDNGKRYQVSGMAEEQGFALQRNEHQQRLDDSCVSTFAYWRPSILAEEQLLNSQTGLVQDVGVRFAGFDQVDYNGLKIDARHYVLSTEDGDIDLWYTLDKHYWLALEAPARGNRVIRYVPTTLPAGAIGASENIGSFSRS